MLYNCETCIDKCCIGCAGNNKFAIPYQQGVDSTYYEMFFSNKGIPWFCDGINEEVKRKTEGDHPQRIKDMVGCGKVLDVGAGQGWLVGFLRELGVKAFGGDYSEYAIKNSFIGARDFLNVFNSQSLPFKNELFDFTIAREVLEHLTVEEAIRTISEMERVTKIGGFIYFTIWLNFDKIASPDILCHDIRDISHKTFMPREFWERIFTFTFPTLVKIDGSNLDWMNKKRVFLYKRIK